MFIATRVAGLLFAAVCAAQQSPVPVPLPDKPGVGPIDCPQCPGSPALPHQTKVVGIWPMQKLYELSLERFGKKRTEAWLDKGMRSLQQNIYRKFYIEKGYILFPRPIYGEDTVPHYFYVPENASDDPVIVFHKDIHRLEGHAAGMAMDIARHLRSGKDPDLTALAGKTMFDSKFTDSKDWNFVLSEKNFGKTSLGGHGGPFYYKLRQYGFGLRTEAGAGKTLQFGKAPYFIGGSVGGEAKVRGKLDEVKNDLIPRAKLAFWGKLPFVDGASFGLSAHQNWRYDTELFSTEFRAGLFYGSGRTSVGALAYYTRYGEKIFARDSGTVGGQVFFSPSEAVAFFFSVENHDRKDAKDETRYLFGVDLLARRLDADADLIAAGLEEVPPDAKPDPEQLKPVYLAAREALKEALPLVDNPRPAPPYLKAMRERVAARMPPVSFDLPSGAGLLLSATEIIDAAACMELWRFREHPNAAPLPGWSATGAYPRKPAEVVAELLRRVPDDELEGVERGPLLAQLESVVTIYGSALRRNADDRLIRASLLLAALADRLAQTPYARLRSDVPEAHALFGDLRAHNGSLLGRLRGPLSRSAAWLKQEFVIEGQKLEASLKSYGRSRLEQAHRTPGWPWNLKVEVREDSWPGLLASYGEDFLAEVIAPFRQRADRDAFATIVLKLNFIPATISARVMRKDGEFWIDLGLPKKGGNAELLRHIQERAGEALADF